MSRRQSNGDIEHIRRSLQSEWRHSLLTKYSHAQVISANVTRIILLNLIE